MIINKFLKQCTCDNPKTEIYTKKGAPHLYPYLYIKCSCTKYSFYIGMICDIANHYYNPVILGSLTAWNKAR